MNADPVGLEPQDQRRVLKPPYERKPLRKNSAKLWGVKNALAVVSVAAVLIALSMFIAPAFAGSLQPAIQQPGPCYHGCYFAPIPVCFLRCYTAQPAAPIPVCFLRCYTATKGVLLY